MHLNTSTLQHFNTHFMKIIIPIAFILLAFAACEEVGPDIKPPTVDTVIPMDTATATLRHILIEEFTGVQCVNCPDGAKAIENFINIYGERIVAVSIHAGFFANPLNESQYDFSTDEGEQIEDFVGPVLAYPSAAINRKRFGTSSYIHKASTWAGHIAAELETEPQVGLNINNTYDSTSRNLSVDIEIPFLVSLSGELRLSVLITENDIIDAQKDQTGLIEDYTHRHVFREMLTDVQGMLIQAENIGNSINETFNFPLPPEWNDTKCKVVAFVHQAPPDFEILQAEEKGF